MSSSVENALLLQPSRIFRSLRSILAGRFRRYPVKGHFASSRILFFAGLVIAAITRNERYHQCYAIFFLAQTILISFNLFRTLI